MYISPLYLRHISLEKIFDKSFTFLHTTKVEWSLKITPLSSIIRSSIDDLRLIKIARGRLFGRWSSFLASPYKVHTTPRSSRRKDGGRFIRAMFRSCIVRRTSDHSSWKRKRRREPCALWRVGASRAGASRAWRSRPRISGSTLATSRLGAAPRRETFGRVSKESLGKLNLWNPPDALSEPSSIWNINFDSAAHRSRRKRGAAATRFIPTARDDNWHISLDYQCNRWEGGGGKGDSFALPEIANVSLRRIQFSVLHI